MREEILAILRRARRKWVLTRAAESASMSLGAAGASAFWVEASWLVSSWSFVAGLCTGVVGVLVALLMLFWRPARRRSLRAGCGTPTLAWACLVALAGVVGVLIGLSVHWSRWAVPAIALPVGAMVGAVVAWWKGADLRSVAAYLDGRAQLRERLATASELALSSGRPAPSAQAVYAQALQALQRQRPQDAPMWRLPAESMGVVALSLVLCLVAALAPGASPRTDPRIEQLAKSIRGLSQQQERRLAEAFRRASATMQDPVQAKELARAAAIVEVQDAQELQRILERLEAAGIPVLTLVPPDVLASAGVSPQGAPGGDGARTGPGELGPMEPNGPAVGGAGNVRVYHPLYHQVGIALAESNAARAAEPAAAPFADAWQAAQARANSALARGQVPPQYRQLVRDFFAGP